MESTLQQFVDEHRQELLKLWLSKAEEMTEVEELNALSKEALNDYHEEFFNTLLSGVGDSEARQKDVSRQFAEKMEKLGWPLMYLMQGVQIFNGNLSDLFLEKGDWEQYPELAQVLGKSLNLIVMELIRAYRAYTDAWQKTIEVQRLALRELSAPLIPVFEYISVMPLIGTIDTERAKLIMENLLRGVIEHESQVVLIDITGVPVVDTMVAHHIVQATEAVRLLGARCIIVGIRPEIAQTIVNLGIDLSDIPTLSTLRKGIHSALQLIGRKVVDIE